MNTSADNSPEIEVKLRELVTYCENVGAFGVAGVIYALLASIKANDLATFIQLMQAYCGSLIERLGSTEESPEYKDWLTKG